MADTYRAVIPYESLDPLTIGASGDESKVYRETLELEIPAANLLAAIYPDEPEPVPSATEAARAALEQPVDGPRFSELLAGASSVCVIIDNQFRPTPAVEAPAARPRRDRGRRDRRRPRRLRERQGLPDVRVGHRAEARPREPRPHGAARHPLLPERAARTPSAYTYVGVSSRGTPVWLHEEVASLRRQDLDRPGAGEPLGRRRRRQADPPRGRLRRDDRVEPLRVRPVAADALRRLRGADALGHRRGRDDVRLQLHDERRPRHARPRDRVPVRLAPRGAPRGDPALQRDLRVRLTRGGARPTSRSAASSRRPTTCSSTRAGAACRPTSS